MAAFSENSSNHNITNASYWPNTLLITGLAASIAVNALVTSMIVFRILKATGDRPTSVERTLGSAGSNKFRHIMFIVIESGMALFAIQLVRVVLGSISVPVELEPVFEAANDFVIAINQMLNVIIIISVLFFLFFANNITWLGHRTNDNFGAGSIGVVLRRRRILQGSCRKPSV